MKKGINIWSFQSGTSLEDAMILAKKCGYDGFELALNKEGELSLLSSEKEILNIKSMANDIGIEIPSLATGLYWSFNYTSSDKEKVKKAKEITKKQLEFAKLLGANTILVVPGAVGVDFIPGCEVVPYDLAYNRSLEALLELKGYAEELKINIGLENVWNKFLVSPLEMRDFIDKVNSPYVGAYFDVGNVVKDGYPEHWISILGDRIKKVHFKDFRRSVGNINGFVSLLDGDTNYPEVIKQLISVGYDDYVTGEMGDFRYYPNAIIENTSKAMDIILNY